MATVEWGGGGVGGAQRFSSGSASTSLPTWGTGALHGQQPSIMPDVATAFPASHRSSSADGDDSRFEDISDAVLPLRYVAST